MDAATQAIIAKITEATGKTLEELEALQKQSGLKKHGEIRSFFMEQLALGYGYANTLTHAVLRSDGVSLAEDKDAQSILDEIYSGKKEAFRPVHDAVTKAIDAFGAYETVPKKGYVSLRRKRQFAMVGPRTNTRMEIGINLKGRPGTERFVEQPKGGMCNYIVVVQSPEEIDDEMVSWLKEAYDQAE